MRKIVFSQKSLKKMYKTLDEEHETGGKLDWGEDKNGIITIKDLDIHDENEGKVGLMIWWFDDFIFHSHPYFETQGEMGWPSGMDFLASMKHPNTIMVTASCEGIYVFKCNVKDIPHDAKMNITRDIAGLEKDRDSSGNKKFMKVIKSIKLSSPKKCIFDIWFMKWGEKEIDLSST